MSLEQRSLSMKRFPIRLVILAIVLSSAGAHAQSRLPALGPNGGTEIDALLKQAVQRGVIPGVVAMVANKDGIIYEGAYGLMDVGQKKPMAKDTIFRIASMTKPVTSVAIMMLAEQGKLSLDDPVSKYLDGYDKLQVISKFNAADASYETRPAKSAMTIKQLLS